VFNCLNQFLLTAVLSTEEHVFIVEYVFQEGNRYTNLEQEQFAEKIPRNTLYLITMQFVGLLRNFVKQAQCQTPNEVGDHLDLTMRS
jgi:hypothetical protein